MPSATPPRHPKIAIIGPASLTLASILQKHHIAFTVFEAYPGLRTQGGSLDLHPASGQLSLKEAGLWEQFKKHARPESDVLKIVDMVGQVLWDENGNDKQSCKEGEGKFNGRPEIDRTALATLMFESLDKRNMRFRKKLQEVVESSEGKRNYDLSFANSTKETGFDVVVGGDGAWSKVRKLLSDQMPVYSDISSVTLTCNDVKADPWPRDFVGEGSIMAFGEGCAVQSQRQGDGSLRTYSSLRVPEDFFETCGIDWADAKMATKQYAQRYILHIHENLQRVVLLCTDSLEARPLYELPVGFRWPFRSGATLIGDAAHVFTPYSGEGVNVGMYDALVLGVNIIKVCDGKKSLEDGLKHYEEEMFPRSMKVTTTTAKGKEGHFSATGAKEFADRMKAHYHGQQEETAE